MRRIAGIVFAALILAGCSAPDFANPGERFAKFSIESLLDGLSWEFERAESRATFRTEARLGEDWVVRVQNWEAAKRELVRRSSIAGYESLARTAGDILIRPMLNSRGAQRLQDLRAARMKLDMARRVFDTLAD